MYFWLYDSSNPKSENVLRKNNKFRLEHKTRKFHFLAEVLYYPFSAQEVT